MYEEFANFGAFLLFFVNIPQFIKTWKNRKDLKDLSILTQILYLVVGIAYFIYGFGNNLTILWTYNIYGSFHFTCTSILILQCKIKNDEKGGNVFERIYRYLR